MENHIFQFLIPALGLTSGLVGAYVSLQNRALLAEVRREIAELENRIIARINGTYVRLAECRLREELILQKIGSIEAGKLADVIIISQDLFKIAPYQIGKTKVMMTMVGGKVVYQDPSWLIGVGPTQNQ